MVDNNQFWQQFGNTLCQIADVLEHFSPLPRRLPLSTEQKQIIISGLKWSIDSAKLSLRDIAPELEISAAYLSRILRGHRPLNTTVLKNILRIFRMSPGNGNFYTPNTAIISMGISNKPGNDLSTAIEGFLVAKEVEGKRPATIKFYRENLSRFKWWCKNINIPDNILQLTTEHLRQFLLYVQTATNRWGIGSASSTRKATISTVDAYWRTLNSLFSWTVDEEIIESINNPMRRIKRPRVPEKIVQDIPADKINEALDRFGGDNLLAKRNRALLLIFLDTGARLRETSELSIEAVDFENGSATVTGKGGKEREVGLCEYTLEALRDYIITRPDPNGHLWQKKDGQPLGYFGIQNVIRRLRVLGGNVRWSPHTFRNTFAMNYLRASGDPFTLQILGGWTDLEMPRHYTAALKAEDALKVHKRASPVSYIMGSKNKDHKS